MDAVYAAVPASLVGREQEIEIGPMSGRSNVVFWLEKRGLPATDEIVDRDFAARQVCAPHPDARAGAGDRRRRTEQGEVKGQRPVRKTTSWPRGQSADFR